MSPNVATYQIVRRSRSRISRWIPDGDEVASIAKTISGAANRLDQLDGVVVVDLPAQPPHQHLEHVREGIVVLVPDVRGYRRPIDHLPMMKHEEFQQRELLRCQLYLFSSAPHAMGFEIDLEIRDLQSFRKGSPTTSGERPDPRQKFPECERLGQIIVGTDLEACHTIVHGVTRRKHQYRSRDLPCSELAAEIEAISAGQHYVENDDVEASEQRLKFPIGVVGDRNDLYAVLAKTGLDDRRQAGIVLDKKNSHWRQSNSSESGRTLCNHDDSLTAYDSRG
jgi:hypothetical protein